MSNSPQRQLLTVMFCDMVGYSRMMDEDEQLALRQRNRMEDTLREVVTRHNGRIHQFYGDGALSLFPSSVEAVHCAALIQEKLIEDPTVPVRIGLHAGDVLLDGNHVFGESINVASRIESFSVPGAVLFSEKVYDDLKNQPTINSRALGLFRLKNIKKEVKLYALEHPALKMPAPHELEGKGQRDKRSIAVLPFLNMSSDPENEYFSDGITEEILNALCREEALKVTARTSSFVFKGKTEDVRAIGQKLNVETVLEGSVRKAGNRVRITAQLINTEDGYHLFSETYDRTLDDIFAVQDEIAASISNKLKEQLGLVGEKMQVQEGRAPADPEAYNLYLKGLYHWNQYTPESAAAAIDYYRQALSIDPQFAKAWALLSFCYSYLAAIGAMPAEASLPHARKAAEKALALDNKQELAYCALAGVSMFLDWDLDAAFSAFEKAHTINPNNTAYHYTYALLLNITGAYDEGIALLEHTLQLDPVSLIAHTFLAELLLCSGRFGEALQLTEKALGLFPQSEMLPFHKAWALMGLSRYTEAESTLSIRLPDGNPQLKIYVMMRGRLYSLTNRPEQARKCLYRLEQMHQESPAGANLMEIASLAQQLGDMELAFRYISEAVSRRVGGCIFLLNHTAWSEFRKTSYFKVILGKMGVSGKWVRDWQA
ncbi:MAG: hypothetical protein KDC66_17610 [Phaeodactylibacter sp.]|nr:hypothetical protein [Phaeodactylibacter sp.]MCB9275308.1 guanylate cyclase [Lewinellaceae bacterium]